MAELHPGCIWQHWEDWIIEVADLVDQHASRVHEGHQAPVPLADVRVTHRGVRRRKGRVHPVILPERRRVEHPVVEGNLVQVNL